MIDSTHRLTRSLVVAAVDNRNVKHLASEELQSLGTQSDHDSQQLPGAKMVPIFSGGRWCEEKEGFFLLATGESYC